MTGGRRGVGLALAAAALFGLSGSVAADSFARLSPPQVAEARSLLALVVLAPLAFWRRQTRPAGQLGALVVLGAILAAVTVSYYVAIDRLGVGPGVTIQFLGPVLVLGWVRLAERRSVPPSAWIAAALAVVGVGLVAGTAARPMDPTGVLAAAAAAVLFASYLILGERLGATLSALTVATYGFAFSSLIWLLLVRLPSLGELQASAGHLVWIGLAGTAMPFLLEMEALRAAPSGVVGVAATAEPVIAALAAWVLLDQQMGVGQIVGAAMVVAAVATVERTTAAFVPGPQ